jgi:hypothetical protein
MKRWNQWTRKHDDDWFEQRRRFQKMFPERNPEAAGQKVLTVADVTAPETRETIPNRDKK